MAADPGQAPGSEGGGEGQAAESAGPDFSPVLDRINELGQGLYDSLDDRFADLEGRLPAEPGGQQQEPMVPGMEQQQVVPDGLYNSDGEMDPAAAQQLLSNMVQQQATPLVQQQIQQAVGPLVEQLTDMRIDRDAADLETRYTELKDPEAAQALFDAATEYAERIGADPRTALSGAFLELVHNARRAQDAQAGREPAGDSREPELEAGGAASLAGSGEDTAKAIVGARKRNSFFGM
jgi:hypothetical protein